MKQLAEGIQQKVQELNTLLEEAAQKQLFVDLNITDGLTIYGSAPIAHVQVEVFQKIS